ncbi:hypothetical protein GCM10022214_32910 [Actinomadura miaoliensis]|uniref:Uncharacterized protein n=1 Tax=Actinomadura miaoliensis TaxID=430685 RepID=A0ABP7VSS6_9ACTN
MCALIFEYGIATLSWYAEFALRRRVSMSAIGSVIVMAYWPSLATVSSVRPNTWTFGVVVDTRAAAGARWLLRAGGRHQLDLVMPGSSPRCAISRKHTRHRPNFR